MSWQSKESSLDPFATAPVKVWACGRQWNIWNTVRHARSVLANQVNLVSVFGSSSHSSHARGVLRGVVHNAWPTLARRHAWRWSHRHHPRRRGWQSHSWNTKEKWLSFFVTKEHWYIYLWLIKLIKTHKMLKRMSCFFYTRQCKAMFTIRLHYIVLLKRQSF